MKKEPKYKTRFYPKSELKKFEAPGFAIVYWSDPCHPEQEPPRPAWTFVHENWELSREVTRLYELMGLTHYKYDSKIFDANVFDWDEINGYLLHKYYHEEEFGRKKIKVKNWAIYHDLI